MLHIFVNPFLIPNTFLITKKRTKKKEQPKEIKNIRQIKVARISFQSERDMIINYFEISD